MGILDTITSMAGGGSQNAQAAGGLMQELQQQPGGLGGLLSRFQQNGQGQVASQWAQGQTQPADPNQIEQGVGGSMIDSIAQRTGMSSGAVKMGLAVAVPFLIHHMVQNGHVSPDGQATGDEPNPGGILSSILGHLG